MIRRPPRSTQSRSSAASDVYKRQPILLSLCLQHPQWNCEIEAMRAAHLKNYVIAPTLLKLAEYDERMNSESANILMMGIAAQESDLWYNLCLLYTSPSPRDGL